MYVYVHVQEHYVLSNISCTIDIPALKIIDNRNGHIASIKPTSTS